MVLWVVFIEVIFKISTVKGFVFDGYEVVVVVDFKAIGVVKKIQEIIDFGLIPVCIEIDSKDGSVVVAVNIKVCVKIVWKSPKETDEN